MKIRLSWLAVAVLLLLPVAASAQQRVSGIGFEMGFRTFTPADARISETASTFRLNIQADPTLQLFVHREGAQLSFKNNSTAAPAVAVPGSSDIQGIGIGYVLKDAFRLELMLGHGFTIVGPGGITSSDPVTDVGVVYLYKAQGGAFIDAGVVMRTHTLAGAQPGNALGIGSGGTDIKLVRDLGGTILHLGIGLAL